MKKLILILALGLVLAACAGEPQIVVVTATPVPPTITPVPPTATPIPPTITPEPTEVPIGEQYIAHFVAQGFEYFSDIDQYAKQAGRGWLQIAAREGEAFQTAGILMNVNMNQEEVALVSAFLEEAGEFLDPGYGWDTILMALDISGRGLTSGTAWNGGREVNFESEDLPESTVLMTFSFLDEEIDGQVNTTLAGVWHRLSASQTSRPQHHILECGGSELWTCIFYIQPEPDLGFELTSFGAEFQGSVIPEWNCPNWFPVAICNNAVFVAGGKSIFDDKSGNPPIEADIEYIITEIDGKQVLYEYWVKRFTTCPWFRTFDETLAANPSPYHNDCLQAP